MSEGPGQGGQSQGGQGGQGGQGQGHSGQGGHGGQGLEVDDEFRDLGPEAAWSLSSAKQGNGVEQLRDGSTDTFWQSDGPQPHLINIQFQRKVKVSEICFYVCFKIDESYTPSRISVRIGTAHHDLQEVQVIELWLDLHTACQIELPTYGRLVMRGLSTCYRFRRSAFTTSSG
ncbi:APC10 [Symbiodinium natans]|uniref:APC10 protein n=1 Tax=Symbiodinium natans TaxID=878477 RepID=A0A812IIL5_9DINO|nr:APC10 [Symbiodinium natans]